MLRNFVANKQGIVVGMVVMIVSVFAVALLYIVSMPAVGLIWTALTPGLPTQAISIMSMLNNVCGWTLLVLVIGCLAYGAALAFKRDPVDVMG
jgi:type II secretory pathway component PulF